MEKTSAAEAQLGGMTGTKLAILKAAVELFSAKGFANVGIRDIASAVGIKSSSLYNHFKNKEDIAEQMYHFFFDSHYNNTPPLEGILEQIPGLSSSEALDKLLPPCEGPEVYEIIKKILVVAIAERNNDWVAGDLVTEVFDTTRDRVSAVLDKMLSLDLIHPIDINLFVTIFANFSLSPASFIGTEQTISFQEWRDGRRMLFSLIKAK